ELEPPKLETITEKLVPYAINEANGIRLYISYHQPTTVGQDYDRILINPDSVIMMEGQMPVVNFDIVEVKKALNRIGEELSIPDEYQLIISNDEYINLPTILHSKRDLSNKLRKTMQAYLQLLEGMSIRRDLRL